VVNLEAYFDESGSDDGSPVLSVAGYLFEKSKCQEFDLAWKEVLDRYGLPFFHMVDCAHGNKPFDKLSKAECSAVEREMIELIRSHSLLGFATSVVESDYNEIFPDHKPYGDAYTYCCWTCLACVHGWIGANIFDGKVAYFFEAGHKSAAQANAIMNLIFKTEHLRHEYRYAAHAFVDKKRIRPVQGADLLAWLHFTHVKNLLNPKRPIRADFRALVENWPIETKFVSRQHLLAMRKQTRDFMAGRPLITGSFGFGRRFVATWLDDGA
jgi:hypothetical protein